jgi:hypothetical protein
MDRAIVRALATCLSEQPPDDFCGGARLRQYRAGGPRSSLGAGIQLPANLLRDLGDGGPRYHPRLLPYQPSPDTVRSNGAFAAIRARMEELRRERAQGLRSRLCSHRQSRDAARGTE